jgi:ribosome biogenesis GTPase / thiamine phosphate phosphatase
VTLESLGADASIRAALEAIAGRELRLARVASAVRERYWIYSEAGEMGAALAGALRYRAIEAADLPVTGDWVAVRPASPGEAVIEAVLPRRNCFSRRAPGTAMREQPIAANVDLLLLVCGLDGDYNLRRMERYLTLAAASRVETVVALNKSDLCADLPGCLAEARAASGSARVFASSTRTAGGLGELLGLLRPGLTLALAGSSGAGKSSIVNCLLNEQRQRTLPVRESDSRGRHATTRRELIPLPQGGALIDNPGMREIQLWAGEQDVDEAFSEIASAAQACRFRNCSHQGEPGCAVAAAIEAGEIPEQRASSYRKLRAEARFHEAEADPLARAERKRRDKQLSKTVRRYFQNRE